MSGDPLKIEAVLDCVRMLLAHGMAVRTGALSGSRHRDAAFFLRKVCLIEAAADLAREFRGCHLLRSLSKHH